jgi:hypothetical protein
MEKKLDFRFDKVQLYTYGGDAIQDVIKKAVCFSALEMCEATFIFNEVELSIDVRDLVDAKYSEFHEARKTI